MNLYCEIDESGAGNSPIIMLSTPGLKVFSSQSPATKSVRGIFTITNRTFVVADGNFNELLSGGNILSRGAVVNDGLPVTMAASPQQLLLASGGTAYIFDLSANTLTPISGATFSGQVSQVAICDDFFLLSIKSSKEFYVSAPLNAADWTTNGPAIVSVFPDNIVSMTVVHRKIFFTSDTKSVWYYDSGNIFPFDVVDGSDMDQGCAATSSPVLLDNTVFWLSSDERGHGKVFRANGYIPQRISTHALELAIQSYTRIDDTICFAYQDQGHDFYVMYFPTASLTWVYDVATQMWHQRDSFDNQSGRSRAAHYQCHTFNFGKHLVGDWNSPNVHEMHVPFQNVDGSWSFATDNGALIHRVRRAPHISNEQKRQQISELKLFVETGLGPVPPLVGDTPPNTVLFEDSAQNIWAATVNNLGVLQAAPGGGSGQILLLNGTDNNTSWLVGVSPVGQLLATPVPFDPLYPQSYLMSSVDGSIFWSITISNVGQIMDPQAVSLARPPKVSMRKSADSGHTWSDYRDRSCGLTGEYKKRVRWLRLGGPRDLVIEVSASDPIGWRFVDAYIEYAQGIAA